MILFKKAQRMPGARKERCEVTTYGLNSKMTKLLYLSGESYAKKACAILWNHGMRILLIAIAINGCAKHVQLTRN